MRIIEFSKYQGTGNDFVIVDNRDAGDPAPWDAGLVARICDRRFGVGADGLMLLQERKGYDFEMVYFNADGRESTWCGNGGRCIARHAHRLGIAGEACRFLATDGPHIARIDADNDWVDLQMNAVGRVERWAERWLVDTGSPHCVEFRPSVETVDVVEAGRAIRYGPRFQEKGINVNFVEELTGKKLFVATYERGVEDETLSCGTGVTAAAIAWAHRQGEGAQTEKTIPILTKGGQLTVRLTQMADGAFRDVWLGGPAQLVFTGRFHWTETR
jgi:diaminopimelate epimerase